MKIGVPKEIKTLEFRVGLVPPVVHQLTVYGHQVFVETGAGAGIGQSDEDYKRAGATILPNADEVFKAADMIVKVKEPQAVEIARLKPHHVLFTYLHLAPDPEQAKGLMKSGATAIAYETITDAKGRLPLLAPMSQVAGRMATQVGAALLLKPAGGRGMLIGGVPGVPPAKVVILGGGVSGEHAAEMAVGMRADVILFDISPARLEQLDEQFDGRLKTVFSTHHAISEAITGADLVIGCVLLPGASAPKLIKREDLKRMRKGWCWWMWRSTRAAVSKPAGPPPMPIPLLWWTASSTIAWPICLEQLPSPPPMLWARRRRPTCMRWPIRAWTRRWRRIQVSPRA